MKRSSIPLCRTIALMLVAMVTACTSTPTQPTRSAAIQPVATGIETFTTRVGAAMDASSSCVSTFMHAHDVPSVTPGDVMIAALAECRNFFTAYRGAVRELTLLKLRAASGVLSGDEAEADAQAERSTLQFREIVRETGLNVLVVKRSAAGPENAPRRPGETSPLRI